MKHTDISKGGQSGPSDCKAAWVERREQILSDYFALLEREGSPLLSAGPDVEAQVASQLLAVVDEAVGHCPKAQASTLSSDIGRSRAAAGVHPSVSLAAARLIFVAALPGVAAQLEICGVPDAPNSAAINLNSSILRRMADAAANYVGYLLDKADQAHREEALRLSRDLHDAVGPNIAVAMQSLDLADRYRIADPSRSTAKIAFARESLVAASKSLRALAAETRVVFEPGGLVGALSDYLANMPEAIRYSLSHEGMLEEIPAHYEREFFLILREAIRNAVAHSSAGAISVELRVKGIHLYGTVQDDGCGVGEATDRQHGTGMASMHERAALLGAILEIDSSPEGTRVKLAVPLPNRTGS